MNQEFPLLQIPAWIDLLAIGVGALAGAAGAVRLRFDLIGVLIIAILMGLGGGIIRDLLLGLRPVAVTDQTYLVTAVAAGLASLLLLRLVTRWASLFNVFDALALGMFTIIGVEKAFLYNIPNAGAIFIGVMTGVGGGVVRDLISDQPVEVVRRGTWNAAAALSGALVSVALRAMHVHAAIAESIALVVIVVTRFSALRWGWQTAAAGDLIGQVRRLPLPSFQVPHAWRGASRDDSKPSGQSPVSGTDEPRSQPPDVQGLGPSPQPGPDRPDPPGG
jgi:uncharacterized membrane protein YeiH